MKKIKRLSFLLYLVLSSGVILAHDNPSSHLNEQIPMIRSGEMLVSPILTLTDVPCYDEIWTDDMGGDIFTISNTGTDLLTFQLTAAGFVANITPDNGSIPVGESTLIHLTYSSAGYTIGTFQQDIELVTNDPGNPITQVGNTMVVYTPAIVYGVVTDCITGLPVSGVVVGPTYTGFNIETDGVGYYELRVDQGTYDITFSKLGYDPLYVANVVATQGSPLELNVGLCRMPYSVQWILAEPNAADSECIVSWSAPMGPYEIAYDDGTADEYTIWTSAGGAVAVLFTPTGYPSTVIGGRLNVGDGSFPTGSNFLGSTMAVGILDDDGANGLPGTVLDSLTVTVDHYGWIEFYGAFNVPIESGDFYLVMWQLGSESNSAPIAIDNETPISYRSYAQMPGGDWNISPYQDFMMRVYVVGEVDTVTKKGQETVVNLSRIPESKKKLFLASGEPVKVSGIRQSGKILPIDHAPVDGDRTITNYIIARVSDFDPLGGPEWGMLTMLDTLTTQTFTDLDWINLAPGFYAYAVKVEYDYGQSEWAYSNVVPHLLEASVTINVTPCDGTSPEGIEVNMLGLDYPNQFEFGLTDINGTVVFDNVVFGSYELYVFNVGYNIEMLNFEITHDTVINIVISQKAYPPRHLYVDSIMLVATWDEPVITALAQETFEGTTFPPDGWQATTQHPGGGGGWNRSDDGGSVYFPIPPGDGFYAVTNESILASGSDITVDYLITPSVDLRESADFALYFDHYFTMSFGETAYVEYSFDGGTTWDSLQPISPVSGWTTESIDLSNFSGPNGYEAIWFAFHYDSNDNWACGWAVDNVSITNGPAQILGYYVSLDNAFVAQTGIEDTTYHFSDLMYGVTYKAGISAIYSCALSQPVEYTFISRHLYPPRNLGDDYIPGTFVVPMKWNPPDRFNSPFKSFNSEDYIPEETMLTSQESHPSNAHFAGGRDLWDITHGFDMDEPSGLSGLVGAETNGYYIYSSRWDSDTIVKFYETGLFLEAFTIPGVSNLCDLAYDGTYIYGSDASNIVYEMDFINKSLVSTISAPVNVRAIAYDAINDGFWANDWSSDLTLFDRNGTVLQTISNVPGIYGLAWDGGTDGGPYLWLFEGTVSGGGCWVSQWDIATSGPTGVQHSVSDDFGSDGIAGGLYLDDELNIGTWTLGGTMQGAGDVAFGYDLGPNSSAGIPPGLFSFRLYQDGVQIAEVPYEGQGVDDWINYVINPIDPGDYNYYVTAVYTLGQFGYPGELGESLWSGTDSVHVIWGTLIPFYEGWDQGSFGANFWTTSRSNWVINTSIGSPEPAAEFFWNPLQENDYSSKLTSYPMDADQLSLGALFLDFEIRLVDRNSTGLEKLKVEVQSDTSWITVSTFTNSGSFDWTANHIDISDYALSNAFRMRFNAVGNNSHDIVSWFVDNISLTRSCESISNLTGDVNDDEEVILTWISPADTLISGFNIYRSDNESGTYQLYAQMPAETGVQGYSFIDTATVSVRSYCYQVTCIWENATDYCESAPGFNVPGTEDYVCVTSVGLDEPVTIGFNLFPNPAKGKVTVTSEIAMNHIVLMNYLGQVVYTSTLSGEYAVELNTSSYEAGVYVVQINTDNGLVTKRVVISQ
ncbi:MAG: hypothetical protein A2W85_17160 [Bacteroidetes bacterium GWF2_41_31]|nr:MAG: hypothetical protein A2W85_17160 [Bacteroidetes bacterium GWF2_41_31]